MSPRTGRPIKGDEPRKNRMTIALGDSELALLNECAKRKGVARTDVIVEGVRLVKEKLDGETKK